MEKKKFYQKPWFLILVGLIVLAAIFGQDDKDKKEVVESKSEPKQEVAVSETKKETAKETIKETKKEVETVKETLSEQENNKMLVEKYSSSIKVISNDVLEKLYGKKVKFSMFDDRTVAIYSNEVVKDNEGNEFPISFTITGDSETKDGNILSHMMCLGFKNEEELKSYSWHLLEFLDTRTGEYRLFVPEEKSVLKSIMEATEGIE